MHLYNFKLSSLSSIINKNGFLLVSYYSGTIETPVLLKFRKSLKKKGIHFVLYKDSIFNSSTVSSSVFQGQYSLFYFKKDYLNKDFSSLINTFKKDSFSLFLPYSVITSNYFITIDRYLFLAKFSKVYLNFYIIYFKKLLKLFSYFLCFRFLFNYGNIKSINNS